MRVKTAVFFAGCLIASAACAGSPAQGYKGATFGISKEAFAKLVKLGNCTTDDANHLESCLLPFEHQYADLPVDSVIVDFRYGRFSSFGVALKNVTDNKALYLAVQGALGPPTEWYSNRAAQWSTGPGVRDKCSTDPHGGMHGHGSLICDKEVSGRDM